MIGTNRYESVRIDHQLRGRAGRQGDPGATRFFVSLEDHLVTRYAIVDLLPAHRRSSKPSTPPCDGRSATTRRSWSKNARWYTMCAGDVAGAFTAMAEGLASLLAMPSRLRRTPRRAGCSSTQPTKRSTQIRLKPSKRR